MLDLYINLARKIYFACLSVCLYPINVKTAEPIGPKFCVGPHVAPGKVYKWSKFEKFASIKIRFSLNFWKFWKSTNFFDEIREHFLFCFTMNTKRAYSQLKPSAAMLTKSYFRRLPALERFYRETKFSLLNSTHLT